jgi:hypothetical protein
MKTDDPAVLPPFFGPELKKNSNLKIFFKNIFRPHRAFQNLEPGATGFLVRLFFQKMENWIPFFLQ